jgi:hypothetical protein
VVVQLRLGHRRPRLHRAKSLCFSHISAFDPSPELAQIIAAAAPDQQDAALLTGFRAVGGSPRDGLSGNFFTKQTLAYTLARQGQARGYKSPFWLPTNHPALDGRFLEIDTAEGKNRTPVETAVEAVVFPASRLALGDDAKRMILNAGYLASRGKVDASGINALSGMRVPCVATQEFMAGHPDFATEGWISLDQIMRLGLPLHAAVKKKGGSKDATSSAFDEMFDGGVLVNLFAAEYYNQDQLVKPGRLAMKKMPGFEPLLEEQKPTGDAI